MNHLGSVYLYIALLVITIILFIVSIVNCVYYTDVYNDGSDNLSESETQQLLILNVILVLLLFCVIIFIIYMISVPSVTSIKKNELERITDKKRTEFDEKIDEFIDMNDEINKKRATREQITKIVSSLEKSKGKTTNENKSLKKELNKVSTELEDLKQHYGDLYDEHGNLLKTNEQLENELQKHKLLIDDMDKDIKLKERLEKARIDNSSVLMEGSIDPNNVSTSIDSTIDSFKSSLQDSKPSLFGKDHKISVVSIPELFPENASLDEILDEIPRSSIMSGIDKKDKDYDYGINVERENQLHPHRYESFNFRRTDSTNNRQPEQKFFSHKQPTKEPELKSQSTPQHKSMYKSFMSQLFGSQN